MEPVYFDNLRVVHERGRIKEENHYYAYGLKIAGISSSKAGDVNEGDLKNRRQYQGAFSEYDEDIQWNDFALRNYDPQIARWVQQDPYQQFASPYVALGGDPVNMIDPSGGWAATGIFAGTSLGLRIGVTTFVGAIAGGIATAGGDQGGKGMLVGAFWGLASNFVGGALSAIGSGTLTVGNGVNVVKNELQQMPSAGGNVSGARFAGYNESKMNIRTGEYKGYKVIFDTDIQPSVCADGSPIAYHPKDIGLDKNANDAGGTLRIKGKKVIQGENDPAPGYYVSMTAYNQNPSKKNSDPTKYLDAEKIPYIVVSPEMRVKYGIRMGDIGIIENATTGKLIPAIVGESGNNGEFKEVSIYALKAIGFENPSPRDGPGSNMLINIYIFAKSGAGNGKPVDVLSIIRAFNAL